MSFCTLSEAKGMGINMKRKIQVFIGIIIVIIAILFLTNPNESTVRKLVRKKPWNFLYQ